MVCSGSPAPHFVNNDYVIAGIISSTAHAQHEVLLGCGLVSVQYPCMNVTMKTQPAAALGLHWSDPMTVMAPLWLCYGYAVAAASARREAMLRLPGQPGEKKSVCSPYGSSSLRSPKASVYNAGDSGSVSGLGRSPGEGNGNPLQYYCLENPMDRGAW